MGQKSGWIYAYNFSWVVKFSPKDKQDDPWYDVSNCMDKVQNMANNFVDVAVCYTYTHNIIYN
jgi:hypothetical protein